MPRKHLKLCRSSWHLEQAASISFLPLYWRKMPISPLLFLHLYQVNILLKAAAPRVTFHLFWRCHTHENILCLSNFVSRKRLVLDDFCMINTRLRCVANARKPLHAATIFCKQKHAAKSNQINVLRPFFLRSCNICSIIYPFLHVQLLVFTVAATVFIMSCSHCTNV